MDPVKNPFNPGAGTVPPALLGRDDVLEKARIALARGRQGRGSRGLMIVGLRGVGKTVLLREIERMAVAGGDVALMIETPEDKPLGALLYAPIRRALLRLDTGERVASEVKRGLRVLRSFANALKFTIGDVEFGLDVDPERGTADSGDLGADLGDLLIALGEAARARGRAVVLIVDELQYVAEAEFGALIMAFHAVGQRQLPVMLVGGGLPQLRGLAGDAKSYAERMFEYPEVGALNDDDARRALLLPAEASGVAFEGAALDAVVAATRGYPYFLQEWGYEVWNLAARSPITAADVAAADTAAIAKLDQSFFAVRLDRLTPAERRYLRAMAALGPGPHRSGDVATQMGRRVESLAPTRSGLIRKGMIYSPAHGDTAFTVPLFDEFMRRAMP